MGVASLFALLAPQLQADADVRFFIGEFGTDQVIELEQTDNTTPQHLRSTFSLTTSIETDETGPQFVPIPEVTLPASATGRIEPEDFTILDPATASFFHESTEVDGLLGYPPGDYELTFRTADDACVRIHTLSRRLDAPPGASPYNLRTRIINEGQWHDETLCLPKENLVIRWETLGSGLIVFGDREEENRISIRDAETGAIAYEESLGEASAPSYPQIILPGQQGVDLTPIDTLASGRTYDVELEKRRTTIVIMGDTESEHSFTIRTKFRLCVDSSAPQPPLPKLEVSSDDRLSVFHLQWKADPGHDYLILSGLTAAEGAAGEQVARITAAGQVEAHLFSKPIIARREIFRVLTLPK